MLKIIKTILCVIIGLFLCYGAGWTCESVQYSVNNAYTQGLFEASMQPRSIAETQTILKKRGYYKGKIDGIWKEKTEKAYCQWNADKYLKD